MLVESHSGLALDATTAPHHQCRPVLWTPQGLQWQQWRLHRRGRNLFKVVCEVNGMVLRTDSSAGDGSWVWLEKDRDRDDQRWRLLPTEDRSAFAVETMRSEHSLDATPNAEVAAPMKAGVCPLRVRSLKVQGPNRQEFTSRSACVTAGIGRPLA
jgi:hypothetical protein